MVSSKERVFLVTGADFESRRVIIENIKKKIFSNTTTPLSIFTFYPKEIDTKDLQEKILLASFGQKKLIIFKDVYNLPKEVKAFLLDNFNKIISNTYMVLEAENDFFVKNKKITGDNFFKMVFSKAALYATKPNSYKVGIEDFKKSLRSGDLKFVSNVLTKLFEGKNSDNEKKAISLQLLGILVAETSYLKNDTLRNKYFNHLWETDRAIKEKGLDPKLAIELFLFKALGL